MIGRLHLSYLIGICVLAGVIVQEVALGAKTVTLPVAAGPLHPTVTHPTPITATPPAALVATILARPLFNPSRRPTAGATPSLPGRGTPRLSGVIVSGTERLAIFASSGGKPIVASAGQRVGPWIVKTVEPDQVIVSGRHGTRLMQPLFATAPAPPPAGQPSAQAIARPNALAVAMARSKNRLLKLLGGGRPAMTGQ